MLRTSLASIIMIAGIAFGQDQDVTVKGHSTYFGNDSASATYSARNDAMKVAAQTAIDRRIKGNSELMKSLGGGKISLNSMPEEDLIDLKDIAEVLDVLKEDWSKHDLNIVARVRIHDAAVDDFVRKHVAKTSESVGSPTIAFVLTTWQKRGMRTITERGQAVDAQASASVKSHSNSKLKTKPAAEDDNIEFDANNSTQADIKLHGKSQVSTHEMVVDEKIWAKIPDLSIVDAFQQEFKERGFDLIASDNAREIAMAPNMNSMFINPNDRKAIRSQAEKEGANYVARGEASVISTQMNDATGNPEATVKISVEIIDVGSGDVVGSYNNTATSLASSLEDAEAQSIKKVSILAAQSMSNQVLSTWKSRAQRGLSLAMEVRGITSVRSQKMPIIKALEKIGAKIISQTAPTPDVLSFNLLFKGAKNTLGERLIDELGSTPGFSEKEFDGPIDQNGKIVFIFKKGKK